MFFDNFILPPSYKIHQFFPILDGLETKKCWYFSVFSEIAVDLFVTMCYNSITISLEVSPWLKKMQF